MRSKQNRKLRLTRRLAGLLVSGMSLFPPPAIAGPVDWHDLAAKPTDYLGKDIEVTGYCAQGGAKGDVLGYECATEGTVYIDTRRVEPDAAEQKVDKNCGGKDVIERSSLSGHASLYAALIHDLDEDRARKGYHRIQRR